MANILSFIIWVLVILATYKLAEVNDRNKIIALVVAAFFSVFGLIGYFIIDFDNNKKLLSELFEKL